MSDETPAGTIRRAASLMRERAEAAAPGPWATDGNPSGAVWTTRTPQGDHSGATILYAIQNGPDVGAEVQNANAAHIASWHPLVALAVARWLESLDVAWSETGPASDELTHALKVARSYLGETP